MAWQPDGRGNWQKPKEESFSTDVEEDDQMGLVSSLTTYGTETSRNHQHHAYKSLEFDDNLTTRLSDEINAIQNNFFQIREWMKQHEEKFTNFKNEMQKRFEKLDDDLKERFGDVDKIQEKQYKKHTELENQAKKLKQDFDRTTGSLETKHGEIQELLRNKNTSQFAPNERKVKQIFSNGKE